VTRLALTFDVEELDWGSPRQTGQEWDACAPSAQGVRSLLPMLASLSVRATFFCTARFAQGNELLVRELTGCGHEVGSHGWDHRDDYRQLDERTAVARLEASRQLLEKITGRAVRGVRTPRLTPCPAKVLSAAGFLYDASPQPTWIPGRSFGPLGSRRPWWDGEVARIPLSTLPILRVPLSWYVFRVMGPRTTAALATVSGWRIPLIHLYFHPWEVVDLRGLLRPHPFAWGCGPTWLPRLAKLVRLLVRHHPPTTLGEIVDRLTAPRPTTGQAAERLPPA